MATVPDRTRWECGKALLGARAGCSRLHGLTCSGRGGSCGRGTAEPLAGGVAVRPGWSTSRCLAAAARGPAAL